MSTDLLNTTVQETTGVALYEPATDKDPGLVSISRPMQAKLHRMYKTLKLAQVWHLAMTNWQLHNVTCIALK